MKKLILILFIAILLLPSALAQLSCSIVAPAACTGRIILKLTAANDAHAFLPTDATNTPNVLCCTGVADLVESYVPIPNKFVIGLETPADSHVSIVEEYVNEIYITSLTYNVTCGEKLLPAECANYQTCLYEVPSGGADDHVFSCGGSASANKRQVCCSAIPLEEPTCSDTDNGQTYGTQGVTTNNSGSDTDTCNGNTLTETYCIGVNRANETHDCLQGETCINGACVQTENNFPCQFNSIFWADNTNIGLTTAAINLPVYAVITGTGCNGVTADFTILDSNNQQVNIDPLSAGYVEDNGIWYAFTQWTPLAAGNYKFQAIPRIGEDSDQMRESNPLAVTGPCSATEPEGPCPGEWAGEPDDNTDSDCDGIRDCFDYCIGNFGGQIDPNSGCSSGVPSCETEAWDCSGTIFGECGPDPADSNNYLQTREGNCERDLIAYPDYCPPPISERGCVIEEDFPIFGWVNLLAVSLMLIGFYAFKNSKFK